MKLASKFNTMTLDQQEKYLSEKLRRNEVEYYEIKKWLAQVRGGKKVIALVDERPDLEYDLASLKKGEGV